jgi:hypothetical protein
MVEEGRCYPLAIKMFGNKEVEGKMLCNKWSSMNDDLV